MSKSYEKDNLLDSTIIDAQFKLGTFGSILTDYLNHGMHDANHIVLSDRNRTEFEQDFLVYGNQLINQIATIGKCLSSKDYSNDHLASFVFKNKIQNKDYFIYNSRVILICLRDYIKDIKRFIEDCNDNDFFYTSSSKREGSILK